jgi:Lrp/AsnC family transcriptional regulator for asnA, asnC and gidA
MSKFRLDEVDHQILDMLIDNTRVPFTDIAKKITYICRNCTCQSKKMEDAGIIMGSSLVLDYDKLGYSFIAYVGVFLTIRRKQNLFRADKFHSFYSSICYYR